MRGAVRFRFQFADGNIVYFTARVERVSMEGALEEEPLLLQCQRKGYLHSYAFSTVSDLVRALGTGCVTKAEG